MRVVSSLFGEIKNVTLKYGFITNIRNKYVSRDVHGYTQIVDFLSYKARGGTFIKPQIRILSDEISKIYKNVSEFDDRPYLALGNHLYEILRYMDEGQETGRGDVSDWLIEDSSDLHKLTEVVPKYMEETIIPYFEENSSIARIDELLNKYPTELSIHNYLYPLRANVAIIAAKVNGNPDFKELIEVYEKETKDAEETYRSEFVELRRKLDIA